MIRRFGQIVSLLVLLFISIVAVNKVKYRYTWEDTFWRTLLTPITKTLWAENFSEASFIKIKNGMTRSELVGLVGEPLYRNCDKDDCVWYYSGWHKDGVEFDRRWVALDTAGRVKHIWRDFYVD